MLELFLDLLKNHRLSCDFGILWDFSKLFFIGNVMDRVYVSWSHSSLSVHRGLTTLGWRGRSEAREVIVTARRERKEVVRVLTNGAIWR
jgi:hypothetical protein